MTVLYIADIDGKPPASDEETLRFGSRPYMTRRADTPQDTVYKRILSQPGNVAALSFDMGTTMGASRSGGGIVKVDNRDGALDHLADWAFAGRSLTLRAADVDLAGGELAYPSGFDIVLAGVIEGVDFDLSEITWRVRDRISALERPLQTLKFAGDNALPAGTEGSADDLKDKPKPIGIGGPSLNVSCPCVNTSKLIYQASSGQLHSIDGVYDSQVSITADTAYSSKADMMATAPTAGTYRAWLGTDGSYFRINSKPIGEITADITSAASDKRSAGQVFKAILEAAGETVSAADVSALDALNSAPVGRWINAGDSITIKSALDQVAGTVGAMWWPDVDGTWRITRWAAPSGTATVDIPKRHVRSLKRVPINDEGKSIPAWKVIVRWGRNHTVQTAALDTNILESRRAWLREETRSAVAEDAAVKITWPTAPELEIDSWFVDQSDAQAESTRVLAMRSVQRAAYQVEVVATQSLASTLHPGAEAKLTHRRYGLSAGRNFRLLGITLDAARQRYTLTLWG